MCWLALLPLPPPWLCPAALRPPQLWKPQPSSHRGPGLGLELLKKPHTTVAIWPVWTLPGKAPSEEFIFIRPDWELTEKTPIHTAYVKKMKSNQHLTSMLPEAMILFEANKSLAKKKKLQIWGMGSPQKALYSSDILLGLWKATHMYGAVHVSRNDWRCPSLLPLAKPSLCTIAKERLSSVESFLGFRDAATHTQCPQAKGGRFTSSKNQRKSLYNQWLTTTLVERRLQ